jgi:GT2 family glycosyltransferase
MKIHYSTPFSTEKNIGKAYNEFMETVPEGDFVCLRDGDTLFLRPDWGKQIDAIIKDNAHKFKLISCVTNRLRADHQLYNNRFSNDGNISNHLNIANDLYEMYYDEVLPTSYVAGLCLIFNKDTWKAVGGFRENSILFDKEFNTDIRAKFGGNPIGIAKGLYLFHLYRWGSKDPYNDTQHLKTTTL